MKRKALFTLACLILGASLALPASAATDAELMVGRWQGSVRLPNGVMTIETILFGNGTFSTLTRARQGIDTHASRVVGRWYVVRPGWFRQHNDDWAPKYYKRVYQDMPATESHSYRFLDRNRILVDGRVIMRRVR